MIGQFKLAEEGSHWRRKKNLWWRVQKTDWSFENENFRAIGVKMTEEKVAVKKQNSRKRFEKNVHAQGAEEVNPGHSAAAHGQCLALLQRVS